VDDLAPVDEFHIRGREATLELANLIALSSDDHVLDVGCGIGGSARFLAENFGARVTGIDLTLEYCELATELSERAGLSELLNFQQASALALPYADDTFDVVWTEHVQMNIEDKAKFYEEMVRVLRPGGTLIFHDIFAGPNRSLSYPMPWATSEASSFLRHPAFVQEVLIGAGLTQRVWRDCTDAAKAWALDVRERMNSATVPTMGVHLLMGDNAKQKVDNICDGLVGGALVTIQAVLQKR
jgi:ubiquinone/menaquinone biosynthesis C-methylase UbiE